MRVSETFWLTVISQFQYFFIFVSVVLFLLIPKSGRKQYLEVGLILIFSFISESIAWGGVFIFHANMNLCASLLTFVYFPLTILLYRKLFNWRNKDLIAYTLIIAFTIFAAINLFFIQGPFTINSYSRSLECFLFIIIGITYLFGYALETPKEIRIKHPMYWISIAFVFRNSIVLYLVLWMEYLVTVKNSRLIEVYMVHNFVGLIYYVLFWHALTLIRKQHQKTIG